MKQFSLEEYLKNPEKKDAEKKQKALENLRKAIEKAMEK